MKIKKIKENFEDMQLLLEDAYNSGFISEKKFNRYTETFVEASAKLDSMKQLKEENRQLKKSSDIRENGEETRNTMQPDTAEAPAWEPFEDEEEENHNHYIIENSINQMNQTLHNQDGNLPQAKESMQRFKEELEQEYDENEYNEENEYDRD